MENPYGESLWRIPMENPYCSWLLTRVRTEHRCKFDDLEVDGVYFTTELSQCWVRPCLSVTLRRLFIHSLSLAFHGLFRCLQVPPESSLEDFDNCTRYCIHQQRHKPFAQDDVDLCVSSCIFGGGVSFGEFGFPYGRRNTSWPYGIVTDNVAYFKELYQWPDGMIKTGHPLKWMG